jgi:transcription elongation factor Elf1
MKVKIVRFECPHCGATYQMSRVRIEGMDENMAMCAVCGKKMKSWRGKFVLSFRLLGRRSTEA